MTIEQRVYSFSQGSEPRFYKVVSGVIERTYTDYFGAVAVVKPSSPLETVTIETCGEILPTKFCGERPWRLGQAIKVSGGWLHVFDLGAEKAYYEEKASLEKAEEELLIAQRKKWRAERKEWEAKLENSYLNSETSEHILESLAGRKLLKSCRTEHGELTLEFEDVTVTIGSDYSLDDDSSSLTLTKDKP